MTAPAAPPPTPTQPTPAERWKALPRWKRVVSVIVAAFLLLVVLAVITDAGAPDQVRIRSDGCWSASILDDDGQRSVDGCREQTFAVRGGTVIVTAQKNGAHGLLVVQLLNGGTVLEEQSTTAAYGVVTVSH